MPSVKDTINFVGGGIFGNTIFDATNSVSRFDNVQNNDQMSSGVIIILLIAIIIFIMNCVATYKLTNSALQTVLCVLFGVFYVVLAYSYYGLSGYKFQKKI